MNSLDGLIRKYERMPQIYPLFLFVVMMFIAYVMRLEAFFVVMMMVTALQFVYFCFNASYKYAKKMEKEEEPDDDPTGNTNIRKKLYDYM